MKLVIAYIRPERLTDVKQALLRKDITKLSVTNALGVGAEKGVHEMYRGSEVDIDLLKKARLEIAINDEFLDLCVDAITEAARRPADEIDDGDNPDSGEGKIFVIQLADCVRIRDGVRGSEAIG